ncbi:DnaD domain protein [Peribacillus frigoritolerans]|uniref:DnaD domain protein n=1 Tax=Peribacillus frigoritolerans TaxID=450367 RepID=UPI0025A22C24|nr:DnaD domain protein [Peribacillus frigoritolerans]MDM5304006.1 DnaD domain protein [Peribacillus frigoritolerans]MDM5309371.1 DnaD domain protein [Peribacillus frigoritolerans]
MNSDTENKKQELIEHLNKTTPEERFAQLSGGLKPSKSELETIQKLKDNGLPDGVVNVLIEYVLLKSDLKFPNHVAMKIGLHWIRTKVSTVEQAMEKAKKEHKRYQHWVNSKEKEKNQPQKITELDSIKGAIKAGLSDEQLGRYVRALLS